MNFFSHLQCSQCQNTYPSNKPVNLCQCGAPLLVRYNLSEAKNLDKYRIRSQYSGIWDLSPLLPVQQKHNMLTLGEGNTPLLEVRTLAKQLEINKLFIKDESLNPTGSFKAKGLCLAVSRAKELGVQNVSISTAGNAEHWFTV